MKLGEVFTDPDVARAYRHRPEYPPETFHVLSDLIVGPRRVLDVGAGTGGHIELDRGHLAPAEDTAELFVERRRAIAKPGA